MANANSQPWKSWILWTAALVLVAGNALAEGVSWNVSKRPDQKILSLNKQLKKKLKDYSHLTSEPFFVLLSDQTYLVEPGHYNHILNRLYYVSDASAVEEGSRLFIVSRNADIEEIGAWRERKGKIERLGEAAWEIVKGDEYYEIHFAPTSLEDGDIVGFSYDAKHSWPWRGRYLWLADTIPTMMNRTRVKTDEELAYRISGYHFRRDKWAQKILSKSHGVANDVRYSLVDIPALPDGPWTPTEWEFLPYLYVSYRGFWIKELGTWVYNVSWNEVASQQLEMCQELAQKAGEISSVVHTRVGGLESDADKLDALHRFVRDEVMDVSYREVSGDDDRDIVKAVNDRQATGYEKGLILYAMCKAAGIEVELLVGRSRFAGPLDRADPTSMQLVDYVVKLEGSEPRFYAPQFGNSPAGVLPPQLQGQTLLAIPKTLPTTPRDMLEELFKDSGGNTAVVWNEYRNQINALDWAQWVQLPGDPKDLAGAFLETVTADPYEKNCRITLQVTGNSRLQYDLRSEDTSQDKMENYIDDRFADVTVSSASVASGVARNDTLTAVADMAGLVLPPPGEDEWILPATAIYGKPVLSEWNAHDGDPFIVRATERQVKIWRAPLPENWKGIKGIAEFKELHPRVSYLSTIFHDDGDLVVVRTLQLTQGITMYSDLPAFRESLDRIQAHESNPVLVMRK